MAFGTTGKLVSPKRETVGECIFFVYRRKHNRPWMCAEDICSEMDLLSRKAYDIVQALAEYDEYVLEDCFNHTCLLVAERIEVSSPVRGTGAWKNLYFATMEKALLPVKHTPHEFFFKCFPLEFENKVTDENRHEFNKAERGLKLFYSVHLNAERLAVPEHFGCYMKASVPDYLRR